MSFDAIPEDREESHPCHCGGNITKRKSTSGSNAIIWECDNCNFESAEKEKTEEISTDVDCIGGAGKASQIGGNCAGGGGGTGATNFVMYDPASKKYINLGPYTPITYEVDKKK
jgi:hypothetical protein